VDITSFHLLLAPAGQEILQAAIALSPRESDFLIHFQSLSRRYPSDLARLALEIAILRAEAVPKFPFADKLYFTRQALEQSSSYQVSSYRSARYQQFSYLADLGCSIGSDTLFLARIAPTFGLDIDFLRLSMASANLHALGLSPQVQLLNSDLTSPLPFLPGSVALFFDPARRSNHHRLFSVHDYQPPLSIVQDWLPNFPAIGVKISPGVKLEQIAHLDAEVEFISLHGELKEAAMWFGPLKTASRRATVLPGPYQLVTDYSHPSSAPPQHISVPKSFLVEPDPAVIRSGLVTMLGEMLNASQIDPDIAYLTSDAFSPTPFARTWVIEDWFPFQLKRLRSYLREHHIGHLTVKKRGSPIEPEFLIRQLRLKGDQERVLVLSQLRGDPIVLVCIRV
jgi:THUMP domain-like